MADNYLEKQMEDYRKGVLPSPRRISKLPRAKALRIIIFGSPDDALANIVTPFVNAGHHVAIVAEMTRETVAFAQKYGARLFPKRLSVSEIAAYYDRPLDAMMFYRCPDDDSRSRQWNEYRASL